MIKIINIKRIKSTFGMSYVTLKDMVWKQIYLQFSFKDIWWKPKVERNYNDMGFDLYGWLFVFFGKEIKGCLYETNETEKVFKYKGKNYHIFMPDKEEDRNKIKYAIKNKLKWRFVTEDCRIRMIIDDK